MNTQNLLAIDLETGGLNPAIHPILSISAVPGWHTSGPADGNVFHQLVLPEPWEPIEKEAIAVNGYDREAWIQLGAVPIKDALDRFRWWMIMRPTEAAQVVPLAHNAGFDAAFLRIHGPIPALSSRWECSRSVLLAAQRAGLVRKGGSSLDHLAALAGLPARGSVHYGPEDARLCLQGYQWLLRRFRPSLFSRILSSILPIR